MSLKINEAEQARRQSEMITALRFFFSVWVLFCHILPFNAVEIKAELSSYNLYVIVSEFLSHHWGVAVVPLFFIFSGYYLFFRRETVMSWEGYRSELTKRSRTLLVPYLLWNILAGSAMYLKEALSLRLGISSDPSALASAQALSVWDWLTFPIDYPLWYVRDLILVSLAYPLFALGHRYLRGGMYLVLVLLYLLGSQIGLGWLPTTAICYFGIGAGLGIGQIDLLAFARRYYPLSLLGALVLMPANVLWFEDRYLGGIALILTALWMMGSIVWLLERWDRLKQWCIRMAPTSFFIYAIHLIYIESWVKGFFSRTPLEHSGWGKLLAYFLIPLITLGICLGLYYLLRWLSPRSLAVLCGGREQATRHQTTQTS